MKEIRQNRKIEHINNFLNNFKNKDNFSDIKFIHNPIPLTNYDEIDTSIDFFGNKLKVPLMINAITGGHEETLSINKSLSTIAKEFNIPLAIGSLSAGISDSKVINTYKIVNENYKDGIIIANIGADCSAKDAIKAIEILNPKFIQIHLNCPQEMMMREGDRDFSNYLRNIIDIQENVKIPVIVKEVGFGMTREAAKLFYDNGIRIIDVGGSGGTNFIKIENDRNKNSDNSIFEDWGISTPLSIVETRSVAEDIFVIATGGIKNGMDIAKSIALGANMASQAGNILYYLLKYGEKDTIKYIYKSIDELKVTMTLTGAKNIEELKTKNIFILNDLYNLMEIRNFNPKIYANREVNHKK